MKTLVLCIESQRHNLIIVTQSLKWHFQTKKEPFELTEKMSLFGFLSQINSIREMIVFLKLFCLIWLTDRSDKTVYGVWQDNMLTTILSFFSLGSSQHHRKRAIDPPCAVEH